MKTDNEVLHFVRTIVKKYGSQKVVDPDALDADLVAYAKPLDIRYTLSHETRDDLREELSKPHNPEYKGLTNALMTCIDMHPDIIGAFHIGTHANSRTAELNDTVVQLIGHTSNLIAILEAHPEITI
jgi:hypothetical protein